MDIKNWEDWSNLYMDALAFKPLVDDILNHLNIKTNSNPIPMGFSTNAVFKVDDMIIKIFAPFESGANTPQDYYVELASIEVVSRYIKTPHLLGNGLIKGKYEFYYIVTRFIEGVIAREHFKALSAQKRFVFGNRVRMLLDSLTNVTKVNFNNTIDKRYLIHPTKYESFTKAFKEALSNFHQHYKADKLNYIHGDITEDNIIVSPTDELYLIDFADSALGPIDYEYPPIIYGLFDMDKDAFYGFIGEDSIDMHLNRLFIGTLLHEYGGDFILLFLKRIGVDLNQLTSLTQFKKHLIDYYKK